MKEWPGWADWRAQLPFTDAQVVEALRAAIRQMAPRHLERFGPNYERVAKGIESGRWRVSPWNLRMALPYLVRWCELCGKTALYRFGHHGRCLDHKFVRSAAVDARQRRLNQAEAEDVAETLARDKVATARRRLRQTKGAHK